MAAFQLVTPLVLIGLSVGAFMYPNETGLLWCKLGKLIWRISTLGLTDMHWFYREERSLQTGRRLGLILGLIGTAFLVFGVLAISPPNSFAAMSQAQGYLKATYGPSDHSELSCTSASDPDHPNAVVIHYRYSDRQGDLLADWNGHKYTFTEEK